MLESIKPSVPYPPGFIKESKKIIKSSQKRKRRLNKRPFPVIKTTVQNVDLKNVRSQRAGIILYTTYKDAIYFGFGVDSQTHDLTDFGGSVNYRTDKNVIQGALREFNEESLQILEPISMENIKICPVIYDLNNLIIFVHLNIDPNILSQAFNSKYDRIVQNINRYQNENPEITIRKPEVCCITWLSWNDLQKAIISKNILFHRVQKFLSRAGDFSYLL